LPALIGLAACAHANPRPAALAPAEAPAAPSVSAAVPAPSPGPPALAAHADSVPAALVSSPSAAPLPAVHSPSSAIRDTSSDEAFLDTLQLMSADSVVGTQPAPIANAARPDATSLAAPPALTPPGPAGGGAAASAAATWDIDVNRYTTNERVQYYLNYFQGRARDHFEVYLERLGRWESLVRAKLRTAHMPQDLVYLAVIESGMNPNAVSRRRAVGLWQFMAPTGRRYGLAVDSWVDERRDPWRATDAAIRMISELNDHFGSLYLAAAAYDAGPGKIQRGLDRYDFGELQGNDLFFALADERFLRRETKDYVPKLIAAAMIAKEPEKYGFDHIEPWAPLRYDSIEVRDAVGMDVLARLADTTTDAMLELNPEFIRRMTPPHRTVWVRVPVGAADSTATRLAALPASKRVTFYEHVIQRGETLGGIAMRYHVSVELILSANRDLRPRSLRTGRRIVIPASGYAPRWEAQARAPRRTIRRAAPVLLSTVARGAEPGGSTSYRVHIVRTGESAWSISQAFGVSLDALLTENGLTRRSRLMPGQRLRIPD
jgi:peptidoglycan lytic transglycosylase D